MWHVDIYCDFAWIEQRNGLLGEPRFRLSGSRSETLGVAIETLIYGDDYDVRHLRILVHTDDEAVGLKCTNLNISIWVESLETAVSLATGHSFSIAYLPGTLMYAVTSGPGDETCPAVVLRFQFHDPIKIDYQTIGVGIAAWEAKLRHYLFYFRRFVDDRLPLDVRWLNGYRMLEWHFVKEKAGLSKCPEWRQFISRFETDLRSFLRTQQTVVGLLEEGRAVAAHAGVDDRSQAERERDPLNILQKTFRVLEEMVMTVLNEHPFRKGSTISFQSRWSKDPHK